MKSLNIAVLFLLLAGVFAFAEATIIYVPEDYPTIPEAIDASIDGDTVMVLPGEYNEGISYHGKNILITSDQGPDVTSIKRAQFEEGTDTTAILRGFSISATYSREGIRIESANSCIIEGNIIHDCESYTNPGGGGISASYTSAKIRNNIIRNNWNPEKGGGIYIHGFNYGISGNIIEGNIAGGDDESLGGGGLFAQGVDFNVSYNLFANNQSGQWWPSGFGGGGAVIEVDSGEAFSVISNNTFAKNTCFWRFESWGSGLWLNVGDSTKLVNNIFAYNYQGGIFKNNTGYLINDYNLYWENGYGDYVGIDPGNNSLFEDPLFIDPENGDYHLQENSPCIDAGDPDSPLDPDSTRADIGCYFYNHSTDVLDPEPSGPHKFHLRQNYPNPFNGQTIISYYLSDDAHVQLNIINMRGELVAQPIDAYQQKGEHTYTWLGTRSDGAPVATGIYFCELKVNARRDVKAMILLK